MFQGRFKAYLVEQDAYGLELERYIHLNPVRARMVKVLEAYRWSSHRAYLGEQFLPWLTTRLGAGAVRHEHGHSAQASYCVRDGRQGRGAFAALLRRPVR